MPDSEPSFLVNPYVEPVIVRVLGRACFLNSAPVKALFEQLMKDGRRRFIVDFKACTGMDSTFLGILAGLAIQLMRAEEKGSVVLTRLGARNTELIKNLGLHRLMLLDEGEATGGEGDFVQVPAGMPLSELENARMVLNAHENLVELDESNQSKFQDVISFLKNQVESE
jgi:anti-anti-sigma regulatory factor